MKRIFSISLGIILYFSASAQNDSPKEVTPEILKKIKVEVEKKVEKLTQYHDRITKVDVYLKLDNIVHTIKDKVAEIKILIPRHEFFVKQSSKSFEESFDAAMESIITQIKRQKEKQAA